MYNHLTVELNVKVNCWQCDGNNLFQLYDSVFNTGYIVSWYEKQSATLAEKFFKKMFHHNGPFNL